MIHFAWIHKHISHLQIFETLSDKRGNRLILYWIKFAKMSGTTNAAIQQWEEY